MHLTLGMYGMVIVYPSDSSNRIYDGGPTYDKQYEYLLSEMDSRWNTDYTSIGSFLTFDPDLFLLNGKNRSLVYNDPNMIMQGSIGDQLLMRTLNVGYRVNRLIFPNEIKAQVYTSDGRVLSEPFVTDTLIVYPGERFSILAEVLDESPSYVSVDYLDPYRLKFLGRDYIPINDSSFTYIEPQIEDTDTDTIGVGTEQVNTFPIVIYPNPANEELHLVSGLYDFLGCRISDLQGRSVYSKKLGERQEVIDISDLKPGSYFLLLEMDNGGFLHKKFLKQYGTGCFGLDSFNKPNEQLKLLSFLCSQNS